MYNWKALEWALYQVFQNTVSWPDPFLPSAVFYSNDYFSQCIKLVDRVLYAQGYQTTGSLLVQWEQLKARSEAANTKRNEIAHWPLQVSHDPNFPNDRLQKEAFDLQLATIKSHLKPLPKSKKPVQTMNEALAEADRHRDARQQSLEALKGKVISAAEITVYAVEFNKLAQDLLSFSVRCAGMIRLKSSSKKGS